MSVAAFTNAVGTHSRYASPAWSHSWYNQINPATQSENGIVYPPVEMERSFKPAPIMGDFKSAYNYTRSVSKVKEHKNYSRVTHWYDYPGYHDDYSLSLFDYSIARNLKDYALGLGGEAQNLFDASITIALNRLSGLKANLGANLAQSRQTIDLLSDVASRTALFCKAMRRGDFWGALAAYQKLTGKTIDIRNMQKTIADAWLRMSYGVVPTFSDMATLQDIVHRDIKRGVNLRASCTQSGHKSRSDRIQEGEYFIRQSSTRMTVKTVIDATVSNPLAYQLDSAGLVNPLSIAWELVPWSFVVDWFAPVGKTLEACTATVGLTSAGGWTTVRTTHKNSVSMETYHRPGFGRYAEVSNGGLVSTEAFHMDRYARASFPMPRLYADTTPWSTPRAVNALALIRQLT